MTATTIGDFPARPSADRNAFLALTALVWVGVVSGFGTDSFDHVSKYGLDYPLIVHAHAMVFVGWLVLFTVQVSLIRAGRSDLHRRLGLIYISDAGFARYLNDIVATPLGDGFWGDVAGLYLGSDLLVLALGAYDIVTRLRLHPAYIAGVAWTLTLQLTARALLHSPGWKALSLHLIGH